MNLLVRTNGGRRALVPYFRPFSLINEIEGFAQDIWDSWKPFTIAESLMPHMDMYEEKGDLVLKAELPGIKEKDVEITLEGERLTIKAEKKDEVTEETTNHTCERYYGRYYRSLALPYPVKQDKVSATFSEGILELRLPKAEDTKVKKIDIKTKRPRLKAKRQPKKAKQKES
jgi:HSP20 family protein